MASTVLSDLVQVLDPREQLKSIQSWAKLAPLLASLIAPITSLLDIPALTQHWYSKYGVPQKDFTASIILSAIGLAFNLIANALLVARFSASERYWYIATKLSLVCWIAKTIIAMVNLIVFGVFSRNSPGFHYEEAFWCAVISVIGAGVISLLLLFHYIFQGSYPSSEESKKIRVSGRHFMLSIISLTFLLAVQSLIFSKIEGWLYLDGLYFSVVSMLTIGFGDLEPTKTATRILLFPFTVLAIAQLANQVGMIIDFFSHRTQSRKTRWRLRYEALQDARNEANENREKHNPDGDLKKEVDWLMAQARNEQNMSELYDLGWSLGTLVLFWFVGAVIFSRLEGWTYGDGVYFCYVFFLTIGYGDLTPRSAGGRPIFIVYSLMAVPIVASFAVQTVTKILETFSERQLSKQKQKTLSGHQGYRVNTYPSHAELCIRHHRTLTLQAEGQSAQSNSGSRGRDASENYGSEGRGKQEREENLRSEGRMESGDIDSPDSRNQFFGRRRASSSPPPIGEGDNFSKPRSRSKSCVQKRDDNGEEVGQSAGSAVESEIAGEQALKDIDKLLVQRLLQLAVELETQARILLMHALPRGSEQEVLLRADMRLQNREVKKLNLEDPDTKMRSEGLVDLTEPESGDIDIEDRVRRYREIFAAILATGSRLQRLDGMKQLVWERRTKRERQIAEEEAEAEPERRGRLKQRHDLENKADGKAQEKKERIEAQGERDASNEV